MHAVKRICSTAEYPCVKRLRERRLLSFLWNRRLYGAFDAYVYVFSLKKLRSMILFSELVPSCTPVSLHRSIDRCRLNDETPVLFSLRHIQELVKQGPVG
jgi:hypothetical protein